MKFWKPFLKFAKKWPFPVNPYASWVKIKSEGFSFVGFTGTYFFFSHFAITFVKLILASCDIFSSFFRISVLHLTFILLIIGEYIIGAFKLCTNIFTKNYSDIAWSPIELRCISNKNCFILLKKLFVKLKLILQDCESTINFLCQISCQYYEIDLHFEQIS